jgi:hypothetical protein
MKYKYYKHNTAALFYRVDCNGYFSCYFPALNAWGDSSTYNIWLKSYNEMYTKLTEEEAFLEMV